jgi:hypothetical protein
MEHMQPPVHGMTLRDWFAGLAMGYLCNHLGLSNHLGLTPDTLAVSAYTLADAMLRARAAQSPAEVQAAHLAKWAADLKDLPK